MPPPVLILGEGYVGQHLKKRFEMNALEAIGTHRHRSLEFELSRRETWHNLPKSEITYWLFAPHESDLVESFLSEKIGHLGRIVVLGTTSHYTDQKRVTESTPSAGSPRSICESKLIAAGATIVRSSGIIGPQRSPFDWLRKGRIQDLDKTVNLIDVDDLIQFLLAARHPKFSGCEFIAHGFTEIWRDISKEISDKTEQNVPSKNVSGKIIDNSYSKGQLGVKIKISNIQDYKRIYGSQANEPGN